MRLQAINEIAPSQMQCPNTVYRMQMTNGANTRVLYIFLDGEEHRFFGSTHGPITAKDTMPVTNDTILAAVTESKKTGKHIGLPLSEVVR